FEESDARWHIAGDMHKPQKGFTAAVIGKHIHILGGYDERGLPSPHHEIFDTKIGRSEPARPMPTARAGLGAVAIDGILYAMGGVRGSLPWSLRDWLVNLGLPASLFGLRWSTDAVEAYDPRENRWYLASPMPTSRSRFGVSALHNRVHVIGGHT